MSNTNTINMSSKLLIWLLISCCIQLCIAAGTNETDYDKQALLHVKSLIAEDPLRVLASWNDSLPVCNWYGVHCGVKHARVTVLDLGSSKLSGTISPAIANLSFLEVLGLQNNSFGGNIPPEIGGLYRLQSMFLARNNFTGTIPVSLGNLSSISILKLQENYLVGSIPGSLGKLINLVDLELDTNNLVGEVPPSIYNLSRLETFTLGSNQLEGNLPSNFGITLPNLRYLDFSYNSFSGSIPSSFSNLTKLEHLIMPHNKFQGQVPSLQGFNLLQDLYLYDNKLGMGDLDKDLSFVYSLPNATSLVRFVVGNNNFSGTFPAVFCNFSMLSILTIGENKLTGEIPYCIGDMTNLTSIDLRENSLSGAIPDSIGRLSKLYDLHLGDNQLSGHIPSTIGNITLLQYLVLSGNHLQGNIPSAIGHCGNLLALNLSSNNFSGGIPTEIFQLSRLIDFNVSNNFLTGPLSDEVGGLVNIGSLSVFGNLLSGEIPATIDACVELEVLEMEGNFFRGVIPSTLSSLKSLQYLDLSRNNLSGDIPEFLQGLPLTMLNLSYNNLEGAVPTSGIFRNATGVSTVGNGRLCGGLPELKLDHCADTSNKRVGHRYHKKMGLLFGISGLVLLLALVAAIYTLVFLRKRTKKETGAASDLEKAMTNLSYQTLHRATNGFSSENLIGSGASGVVYKGTLEDIGTVIAVKIFNLKHHGASKSFVAECKALRNIRHRNLIKVVTACSSLDYKGNDFKAIVYEYMPNGSLDDWLHPTKDNIASQSHHLDIHQRLDIAVDVGVALEYLHHDCGSSVIHCDLKPSNVLLDEDMMAHVGDFGLAKFLSQAINSSSDIQFSSTGVRGTVGYAPPEYGMGNEASMGGDVYSYGILVLEMFTGRRPTDGSFNDGSRSLCNFVKGGLSEQDIRIADQALLQDMTTDDSDSQLVFEVVISVLKIALSCSAEVPRDRPDITDAVAKLSSIRTKLQGLRMQQ